MQSRSGSVLLVIVVALALFVSAVPAQAASVKVVKGNTQMNMDPKVVASLVGVSVVVDDISPATLTVNWTSGINWLFNLPIYVSDGGSTYDWSAKTGTFYHSGGIRFADVKNGRQTRFQGVRVIASGANSYKLSVAIGTAPASRLIVATSANKPSITKSGKKVSIQGIQFKLTPGTYGGAAVLEKVLDLPATSFSTATVFFDTDIFFTLK
jgi:hypothetical protein